MFNFINPFKKPSARTLAQQALEDTQRSLVQHESAAIYHAKMAEYARENIVKMSQFTRDVSHG